MMKKSRAQRNTSRRQPYAWLGAGALGVGLALAGAGTANADDTSAATETSSARVSASAAAAPGARAATSKSTAAVRTAAPGRSPAATSRSVPASQPVSAAARSNRLTPARAAAVSGTRVAAVAGRSAPTVSASAEASPEVPTSAPTAAAASAGVVTPAPSQATIAATAWFSSTRSWLNEFDGPLATAAQDVLVGVQRTLFSPAPTVKPVQYSTWTPGEPILGALKYVQPGGAAVSMQLTQAPTFGTVQLLSSGAYTYTPGPDFTGTDSFTAEVTAGGFNILEPFTPRTATVAVNINPSGLVKATQGFDITNLSGQAVQLTEIQKEPGYESDVDSQPVGKILGIGETTRVELTFWVFYGYQTNFVFKPCVDVNCAGASDGGLKQTSWRAAIREFPPSFADTRWGYRCEEGDCTNGYSPIGPPANWSQYYERHIYLLDPPGTSRTLSGDEAQSQAKVINAVCATSGSFCQFEPSANTQNVTKAQEVFKVTNNTQSTQTVTKSDAVSVSATSSFGTTYTSEVSASFGQKDVFNIAAKQTFSSTESYTKAVQKTSTYSVNTPLPPGYVLTTTVDVPVVRVTGKFNAVIGNTTYNLTGVSFDFVDPNAPAQLSYTSNTAPVSG